MRPREHWPGNNPFQYLSNFIWCLRFPKNSQNCYICRDHFVYAPSQWKTTAHCNVVSHWLGAYAKWSLHTRSSTNHVNTNLAVCGFSSVRVLTPSSAPQPCSAYATPGRDLAMRPEGIIRAPASWRLAALVDWGPCVDCQVPVERTTNMDDLGGGYWSFRKLRSLISPLNVFSISLKFILDHFEHDHIHLIGVPQLSCDDTSTIWTRYSVCNVCLENVTKLGK